jgi:hypothetical protein
VLLVTHRLRIGTFVHRPRLPWDCLSSIVVVKDAVKPLWLACGVQQGAHGVQDHVEGPRLQLGQVVSAAAVGYWMGYWKPCGVEDRPVLADEGMTGPMQQQRRVHMSTHPYRSKPHGNARLP